MSVPDAKFTKGEFEVSMLRGDSTGYLGEGRGCVFLAGLEAPLPASTSSYHCLLFPFHR